MTDTPTPTTVAVAGATGRTGSLVVQELLRRGFAVRALVRNPAKAFWIQEKGGEVLCVDISSRLSLEQAVEGADAIISALGSKKPFSSTENNLVDNMGNQNLASAARSKGIGHLVIVSSIGAGDSKNVLGLFARLVLGPVLGKKETSEAAVRSCGVDYTIIRPGGLSNKELSGSVALGEGGKITGSVSRRDVARVCVDALSNPAMKNRTFEVVDTATLKESMRRHVVAV